MDDVDRNQAMNDVEDPLTNKQAMNDVYRNQWIKP